MRLTAVAKVLVFSFCFTLLASCSSVPNPSESSSVSTFTLDSESGENLESTLSPGWVKIEEISPRTESKNTLIQTGSLTWQATRESEAVQKTDTVEALEESTALSPNSGLKGFSPTQIYGITFSLMVFDNNPIRLKENLLNYFFEEQVVEMKDKGEEEITFSLTPEQVSNGIEAQYKDGIDTGSPSGSTSVPLDILEKLFENNWPNVTLKLDSSGELISVFLTNDRLTSKIIWAE